MADKIILITGATDGIGKATAMALAKAGHTVIIHGRNEKKAEAVKQEIMAETGNDKIDLLIADLLSLADTRKAIDLFTSRYKRLDVLINNAGAFFNKVRETTAEGLEKTITLNLFAPFLLMQSLLGVLQKSPAARIINVSSAMHKRGGKPDFTDFQLEKTYKPDRAYGLSKLYLIWITRYFAKQLKENGINNVTVNACHPGAVATNFGQDADKGFFINMIFKIALRFMDKVEDGARTSIYLATAPEVQGISGEFFGSREKIEKADDKYYSTQHEQLVWDYCASIVKPYL
ncbi:SDR family oxidoreductase [Chitinophaga sp. Cy-1792]|uniref:SDR family oxidoreductase n=1 Tax=Chitinophaga sp. Cy-1792 TaxID=2608339 RepID=UPI00142382C1|nr:SDR family oxidoreductase [Chitinophaga sp. Cy-1792]NIG56438.1 SDR family oxidoreductase [Chitinophaga sp. Cy-1792]